MKEALNSKEKRLMYTVSIFSKDKAAVKQIYYDAFPSKERMPFGLMLMMTCFPTSKIKVYRENDKVSGFLYYAVLGKYVYILFFAVDQGMRGSGIGSKMLQELRALYPKKKIVVSIEPPTRNADDWSAHRKNFYIRNGYEDTGYNITILGIEQEILFSGGAFSKWGFGIFLLLYSCLSIWPIYKRRIK